MRILIADDDVSSRGILASVLRKGGHEVLEAVDGEAALNALLEPDAPRLAILDWMMPTIDGLEVVRRLRARQSDRPAYVIMLTAKNAKADIVAGLDAGADDYLPKPSHVGELRARVGAGVRLVELQNALAAKVEELHHALDHIKTLRGIVPICANCKKIRDDQGYWKQVEVYVRDHSEAEFSHGICPECIKKYYPEFVEEEGGENKGS